MTTNTNPSRKRESLRTARVAVAMIYLDCPWCNDDPQFVGDGSFVNDQNGAYSFSSDSTVEGHRLNGRGTITCPTCSRKVRVPLVRF